MNDQPAPLPTDVVSCANCFFARRRRLDPAAIEKVILCYRNPPQAVHAQTQRGPVLVGSVYPPVSDQQWCFQFRPAENSADIESEGAPKIEMSTPGKISGKLITSK